MHSPLAARSVRAHRLMIAYCVAQVAIDLFGTQGCLERKHLDARVLAVRAVLGLDGPYAVGVALCSFWPLNAVRQDDFF